MNINSVNPLYLGITRANGYIEEKGMDKYLVFDSTDENKELLEKYNNVLMQSKIKSQKWIVVNVIMNKITWRLNLIQMMTCH